MYQVICLAREAPKEIGLLILDLRTTHLAWSAVLAELLQRMKEPDDA